MKLYTEEQVREALRMTLGSLKISTENDIVNSLNPIYLPSDEEIDKEAFQVPYDNTKDFYDLKFIKGAKWMRDKIKGTEQ